MRLAVEGDAWALGCDALEEAAAGAVASAAGLVSLKAGPAQRAIANTAIDTKANDLGTVSIFNPMGGEKYPPPFFHLTLFFFAGFSPRPARLCRRRPRSVKIAAFSRLV